MTAKKKSKGTKRKTDSHERLKWETARELGLDDDLAKAGDELTVREAGKIGGQMVKKTDPRRGKTLARENQQEQGEQPDNLTKEK